ncbi:MAG: YihY/virulence factor BrkB family protein [Acidiferrobacteraceae bacterium]
MSAKHFVHEFRRKVGAIDITGYAAELAYYLLFSIFPFFLFLAALLAYIPIPHLADKAVAFLQTVLPPKSVASIAQAIHGVLTRRQGGLVSVGALISLLSASSAVSTFSTSLNLAYGVREQRPYWKVRLIALALTLALTILVVGAISLYAFGSMIDHVLISKLHSRLFHAIWTVLRRPIALVFVIIGLILLYCFSPSATQRWRSTVVGAIVAVIGIVLLSAGFGFYISHFGSYNKMYGSIGGVIVLLTWFFLAALMVLVGGIVNSIVEEQGHAQTQRLERRTGHDRRRGRDVASPG